MVAIACSLAGLASGEPDVPEFDSPLYLGAPLVPEAIAATPVGYDLVGSGGSQTPDGYPEVAVASPEFGIIRIYRNNSSPSDPDIDLDLLVNIDVFGAVELDFFENDVRIRDITFVNLSDTDDDPDLVVALSYRDSSDPTIFRGKVASFRSVRNFLTNELSYEFVNAVDTDYPVTGLAWGEYSTDGRNHVLATCEWSDEPGTNPSRVFPIRNIFDSATGDYGRLEYPALGLGDLATFPMGTNPTHNVVAGQFSKLSSSGSGNTLDFAAFGAANSGITLGVGNAVGAFTFNMSSVAGASCGSVLHGFGAGATGGFPPSNTAAIVQFDPFSNTRQSLATHEGVEVTLIHNDPRFGSFFHLCSGDASLDTYTITPVTCPGDPILTAARSHLTKGRLNADAFEDLVFINADDGYAALLLGKGSPGGDGRIMDFSICTNGTRNHFLTYAMNANSAADIDHVECVDLNLDGFDEIVITRSETSELLVLHNITGQ